MRTDRKLAGTLLTAAALALGVVTSGGAAVPPQLPPTPASALFESTLRQSSAFVAANCSSSDLAANPGAASACETAAEQVGVAGYVYGIAPMEFLRQRRQQTSVTIPNALSDAPVNHFGSARNLAVADPAHEVFVQPNNDTLYSMAHLDLGRSALVLHVPAVPRARYYVMQFLDPYTNVFAYVGTRTTGDGAGNYLIAGPGFRGTVPRGLRLIRSPYRLAWIAGRTLVNGAADLRAVHRVQSGYRLVPLGAWRRYGLLWHPPRPARRITTHIVAHEPTGIAFFDALGDALRQSPPPAADAPTLADLAKVGIGPGRHPSHAGLSAPVLAGLAAAVAEGPGYVSSARTTTAAQSSVQHHGWFVPFADTGDFGTDYDWRAIVALYGLAANRPVEAVYTIGVTDNQNQQLDGGHAYVIHFAAGNLPPTKYFWSLTMYDENFFLVPNAINRYALGNRSPMVRNADGSLDIYLQHTAPPGHRANWLPAPATGNFRVTLRMYGPAASVLDDTYSYPRITKTS